MIDSDKAIVVDYKASSIVRKAHKKQVEQYVSLIKKMGYQTVEGYVWYLHSGVIKNIETDQFEN
jgi:CRISPR/Cas system-associated exonuclease Cas4 (RecB family)